jgi:hypothetical protein
MSTLPPLLLPGTLALFVAGLGVACEDSPRSVGAADGAIYLAALSAVAAAPADAVALCAPIQDAPLRADCVTSGAERVAMVDAEVAAALCASLVGGFGRDECGFQVAERSGDVSRCDTAGRFSEDCRMHLWSRTLREHVSVGAAPADAEQRVVELAREYGFEERDPRVWIGLTRYLLGPVEPLDRGVCHDLEDPQRRMVCKNAARDLFNDRLNFARDKGLFPCEGGALPASLVTVDDPELEAIIEQRKQMDLCP